MNSSNSRASATAERQRFPFSLIYVIAIVATYAAIHALTRLLASGNLGEDDPLDNLLIQTLAPGYSVQQGPLYDWILWLLQQIFGTGLQSFLLLKYSLLVIMAGCLFQITRRLTQSAMWAFIAVESMATVYQIFWRFHEGFTHRVGAMALSVATVWAILRLVDRPTRANYLLVSVLIGLGLLSEHIYAFVLPATLLAASLQQTMRARIFSLPMLLSTPVALLIASPYAYWLMAEPLRLAALGTAMFPEIPTHSPAGLGMGLRDAASFPLLVLAPYIVILPLVFPAIFRTIFKQSPLRVSNPAQFDPKLFILHLLIIELAGNLLFNGLLYSRSNYAVHSILPMLVIAIPWLTAKAQETAPTPRRVRVFMSILLAFTITAYAVRSGNLFVYEPFCSRCRWGVPYADLATTLRDKGFHQGTIIAHDPMIGGNLRRFFPDSRIIAPGVDAAPPMANGQIAIIWPATGHDIQIPEELHPLAPGISPDTLPEVIELPWKHLWKPLGYRTSSWATVITGRTD